jgi:hypothetical protein
MNCQGLLKWRYSRHSSLVPEEMETNAHFEHSIQEARIAPSYTSTAMSFIDNSSENIAVE